MIHLQKDTTLQGGKYRINCLLGQGGFGNTYAGYNTTFDERIAIKEFFMQGVNGRDDATGFVSVSLAANIQQFEEQREKFKKEALRIRKLNNPHIIKVHDLFEENGTIYYVMDFVDGENLAERLKRTGKPFTKEEVEAILMQILDALKTVHEARIWHLDLKPANIMINKSGNVTLIDFGASKQLNTQKGGATTSTAISYTNGYAPREQMEQNYDKFGPWTNFYSLGTTLYTLLTNKRPSLPTDIDDDVTEDKHVALPFPPEVTNTIIHKLILWMMSTNRNLRPQCVEDILAKLNEKDVTTKDSIDEETLIAIPECKRESIVDKTDNVSANDSHLQLEHDEIDKRKSRIPVYFGCGFIVILIIGAIIALNSTKQYDSDSTDNVIDGKEQTTVDTTIGSSSVLDLIVKSPLGEYKYIGTVNEQNLPDGWGEAIFSDGRTYRGNFTKGNLTGPNAFFRYPNGDVFEGTFKDNSFHEGKYTIAEDGSYFIGTFKNGQPNKGIWYNKNGKTL